MANPKKIKSKVRSITPFGNTVYKVDFETEGRYPRFKAGQFLHLTIDEFDPGSGFWPESRVFSIAECGTDRKSVSIIYSVVGQYTERMRETLSPGKNVWLKLPYGKFIIENYLEKNARAILIAGGTGIAPYIPFLQQLVDTGNTAGREVFLAYGIRNPKLLLFSPLLNECINLPHFDMTLFLEEGNPMPNLDTAVIEKGQLSIDTILRTTEGPGDRVFFISGPPDMLDLFKEQLTGKGIAPNKIIIDEW